MSSTLRSDSTPFARTLDDPITGEELTFLETSEESSDGRVVVRVRLAPGMVMPLHAHPWREDFECIEGSVQFQLDGRAFELRPGHEVVVESGRIHGFSNQSGVPVAIRAVGIPGPIAEYNLRVKFRLSLDGYLPTGGGPPKHPLLAAIVLHRSGMYFPPLPRWLFRGLIAALAALGRWRGHERFLFANYPEYERLLEALGIQRPSKTLPGR